ncbi:sensor histidine kinase [Streptomyces sp. NBC_01390]|uniref:sensor histidine kinase n=1 Tax=Streptomyces sp. NBC_01390 TaxID=2903850 RepID=UPI00324BE586
MAQLREWDRWTALGRHAFFLGVLVLFVMGALVGTDTPPAGVVLRIAPAAALAAWYGYWVVLRGGTGHPPLPYLVGAAVGWAVMVAVDPALLPAGLAVLVPYCVWRARWSAAGVLAMGAAWLWQRFTREGSVGMPEFVGCSLGMVVAVTVVGFIATVDHESHKRQRLLDELTATQAERAAAERQAGILAERQRLAREVHDTLTQGFTSIAMLLDSVRDDLPPGTPAARRVEQAMRTARDNLAESRRLVYALHPVPLDGMHLRDAVRELTARLAEETGIDAYTTVTGRPAALSPGMEGELLRVVQEALNNARRHAHAASVSVTLSYLDDVLAVDIQDDGNGFTPTARHYAGVGLISMRERVATLSGTFTVESAPGEGTTIAVTAPLAAPEPAVAPSPATPGSGSGSGSGSETNTDTNRMVQAR